MNEKSTEPLRVRELAYRKADKLEVTLWWVQGTLDSYVHVVDYSTKPPSHYSIDVKPPMLPNEVYMHPMAYISDQPTQELEVVEHAPES